MATPKGPVKRHPAIIMVHEWWGLDGFVKTQADRWAQKGYLVLAVDLFNGKTAKGAADASRLQEMLVTSKAVKLLSRAQKLLQKNRRVDPKRIGFLGWGLGAKVALQYAITGADMKALAMFYGQPILDVTKLKKIRAPLMAVFGTDDEKIPKNIVTQFKEKLLEASVDKEVHSLKGKKGFMNSLVFDSFEGASALKGEELLDSFFKRRLKIEY